MPDIIVTVTVPEGLHARPAAELVRLAATHPGPVRVGRAGPEQVDAASILAVMSLDVRCGETVAVSVEGANAAALLERIAALLDPA